MARDNLTAKQEELLISFIVEYVDKNPHNLPGYIQLFDFRKAELIGAEITQQQIKDFYQSRAYAKVREIKDKFNRDEVKDGFKRFAIFYKWFVKQLAEQDELCYYCETPKWMLEDLFRSKNESKRVQKGKPLYSEKPSFSSSFHIDRKVPNGGYGDNGNCVLACAFCNNAKSDMVKDADEFKSAFGIAIFSFYTALLDKRESIEMEENHKKIDKLMEWAKEKLGIERFNKLFK